MFGNLFNTAEVDALADWVVNEVKKQLPPSYSKGTKNVGKRTDILNERISKKAFEFSRTATLNLFKKARLTARVRDAMLAEGYPENFVRIFSLDLVTRISNAAKQVQVNRREE